MRGLMVAVLIATCSIARAQAPAEATAHAPDGGTIERVQSISIFPLAGAPFSATVATEWTKILADGSTSTMKNHRTVARDSSGRIFEERRWFSPTGDVQVTRLSNMQYSDPVRHEYFNCILAQRTCYISDYKMAVMTKMPAGITGLQVCACASRDAPDVKITHEPLGQKTIDNLDVMGSREITILPAGQIGNAKPQPIVKEFWFSPRLGINLVTKRFDPRAGSQNFVLDSVSLDEPDPKLFEPPADYRLVRQVVVQQGAQQSAR